MSSTYTESRMPMQIFTSSTEVAAAILGITSPSIQHLSLEIISISYDNHLKKSVVLPFNLFRQRHHLLSYDSTLSRNHKPLLWIQSDLTHFPYVQWGEIIIGKRNRILTSFSLRPRKLCSSPNILKIPYRDWIYLSGNRNWILSYLVLFPEIRFQTEGKVFLKLNL